MSEPLTAARLADKVTRRRGRILMALAVMFIVWQTSFYGWGQAHDPLRTVDHVRIGAWIVWAGVLLLMLAIGGAWLYSREVRRLVNDESALFNRQAGQQAGFFAAMIAGVAVYLVNLFEPVGTLDAVHAVMTAGIGVALVRYALLERRAERGT